MNVITTYLTSFRYKSKEIEEYLHKLKYCIPNTRGILLTIPYLPTKQTIRVFNDSETKELSIVRAKPGTLFAPYRTVSELVVSTEGASSGYLVGGQYDEENIRTLRYLLEEIE